MTSNGFEWTAIALVFWITSRSQQQQQQQQQPLPQWWKHHAYLWKIQTITIVPSITHHPSKCQKPTCKYVHLKGAKLHFGLSNEPVVGQYQTGCNLWGMDGSKGLGDKTYRLGGWCFVAGWNLAITSWGWYFIPTDYRVFIHARWWRSLIWNTPVPKLTACQPKMEG